jgi:hypothetical protein
MGILIFSGEIYDPLSAQGIGLFNTLGQPNPGLHP